MDVTKRQFLFRTMLASAASAGMLSGHSGALAAVKKRTIPRRADAFKISVFSKSLHWLGIAEMADAVAEMGFDGIDLTVRSGGHVEPASVVTDLPKAVEIIRRKGLEVYMITTSITEPDHPYTAPILETAAKLGITHYRMGWIGYKPELSVEENLLSFKKRFKQLAQVNEQFGIQGNYQNHSGTSLGAPVWDLSQVLDATHSEWIGSQYDIVHATVEGAHAWQLGLELIKKHIKTIDIKDFDWAKKYSGWVVNPQPLGGGMVDFKTYLQLLKKYGVAVPISMHYEYDLGGAELGKKTISFERDKVLSLMKKDLDTLKELLMQAQLRSA
jgi:L-ribulose-5-phosphate 3-epimerase